MWRTACHLLVALLSIPGAIAIPRYMGNRSAVRTNTLLSREDEEFYPNDLSFIRTISALGDSYSAGIGSGDRLGSAWTALNPKSDWACSRYAHSYPYLVYTDTRLGSTPPPNWNFLSCSGAVMKDVVEKQLPDLLNGGHQAVMLSIGGNDAELANILNVCVFQWAVISKAQLGIITVDRLLPEAQQKFGWSENHDFEPNSRTCEEQLQHTETILRGNDFKNKLDQVMSLTKQKLAPGGKIYWTGYGKFFAESYTPECDTVSWSTWISKTNNISRPYEYLTRDRRRAMNNLVDLINQQLADAAKRAGDQVIFINYDKYVGDLGGRYCEAGVDETTKESNTRTGLMFYELNTWDPMGSNPWKRDSNNRWEGTFEGDINNLAYIAQKLDPSVELRAPWVVDSTANSMAAAQSQTMAAAADDSGPTIPNFLPDGYGRVFHPQVLLHQVIANLVIWNMMAVNEKAHGYLELIQDLPMDTCPLPPESTKPPSFYARILPLGASIVWGVGSSDGNGFRKPLRDRLRQDGWEHVNMVGSQNSGPMIDNNVEARSGDRIDQISAAADQSIKFQPNIVVINAGTNDCLQSFDIGNAGARYGALLDKLLAQIPGVTIVVSTVLPGTASGIVDNRGAVNAQIRDLVNDRRFNRGQKVVLADVDAPAGFLTKEYITGDGIHPNDEGHRRLAAIFHRAIKGAHQDGLITEPKDTGMSDDPGGEGGSNTCDKVYGSGNSYGPVTTQAGSGLEDGVYSHNGRFMTTTDIPVGYVTTNYTFARVFEPFGAHDFVYLLPATSSDYSYARYIIVKNQGDGNWQGTHLVNMPDKCIPRGVRFADVNADGLDDMLCVSPNGDVYVSINTGRSDIFTGPLLWKSNEGSLQARVRLADIDGDGRADYCTIADNGDIRCWRNWGTGDLPIGWQDLGVVFTGKGMGDVDGVRFADINGDGRDDWLWVDNTGQTWTYTNNRGCTKNTLAPLWRAGINAVGGAGSTHAGMGKDVGRNSIHFVNVYNSPGSFSLRGRADYVWVEPVTGDISRPYKLHIWKNVGAGGAKLRADGDRYCKMMDRSNKAMDYVWVHSTGYMRIYESRGGTFPSEPPYWSWNYVFWTASDYLGREIDRRDLHLADWDGDGLCDIIYVNPDTGYMDGLWLNKYRTTRDLTTSANWVRVNNAGPRGGNAPCPERRGVGIYDLAVRFADIDGNGRSDYLCIEKDGRTWGYLNNNDGGLTYISQFKKTEGKDRANIRWVDVNGDGRDDFLWVDKFNGDGAVWYNRGATPASGSAFTWDPKGSVYQGALQGSCEHFPDLDGNGRADLHAVDSVENTAVTWFNVCPGEHGTDNGDDSNTLTAPSTSSWW